MYLDTNGKMSFYGSESVLSEVSDWFEESEYGSASMDAEDGSLIVYLDSEAIAENKDSIIAIMTEVYKTFPKIKSALACGEYSYDSMEKVKKFDLRLKDSVIKYRETDWVLNDCDDKDYDELMDEGLADIDEDEYCEHQHRVHSGIDDSQDDYGDWEYIDID